MRRFNMGAFPSAPCGCALLLAAVCSLIARSSGLQRITTVLGHNVTLPCRAPSSSPIRAAEWSRPDQDPQYVFFYRNKQSDTTNQHSSFVNRVELADSQINDGNLSLLLKNVISSDTGIYECRVNQDTTSRQTRAVIRSEPINTVKLTVIQSRAQTLNGQHAAGNVGMWLSVMPIIYSWPY